MKKVLFLSVGLVFLIAIEFPYPEKEATPTTCQEKRATVQRDIQSCTLKRIDRLNTMMLKTMQQKINARLAQERSTVDAASHNL